MTKNDLTPQSFSSFTKINSDRKKTHDKAEEVK